MRAFWGCREGCGGFSNIQAHSPTLEAPLRSSPGALLVVFSPEGVLGEKLGSGEGPYLTVTVKCRPAPTVHSPAAATSFPRAPPPLSQRPAPRGSPPKNKGACSPARPWRLLGLGGRAGGHSRAWARGGWEDGGPGTTPLPAPAQDADAGASLTEGVSSRGGAGVRRRRPERKKRSPGEERKERRGGGGPDAPRPPSPIGPRTAISGRPPGARPSVVPSRAQPRRAASCRVPSRRRLAPTAPRVHPRPAPRPAQASPSWNAEVAARLRRTGRAARPPRLCMGPEPRGRRARRAAQPSAQP